MYEKIYSCTTISWGERNRIAQDKDIFKSDRDHTQMANTLRFIPPPKKKGSQVPYQVVARS